MSNTMVRRFCTLKEAAEQLAATPEQMETLLRRGVLREFRDGPHRLLRTADVAAIAAARDRRDDRRGRPQLRDAARSTATRSDRRSQDLTGQVPLREPTPRPGTGRAMSSGGRRTLRSRRRVEAIPERQGLSIRQWFWSGLTQDRPITIALFAAFILLAISAAVAGAWLLAGTL